ncbi:MAG TPA: GNAT family N-acetyltransferase [Fimbriimonas sp.]
MNIREIAGSSDPLFEPLLELYHREFPPETREPDERLAAEADGGYRIAFRFHVAEEQGTLAGFVRWGYLTETNAKFIIHLAVEADYRRQALGRKLVHLVLGEDGEAVPTLMEIEPKLWPWWESLGARVLTRTYTQPSLGEGLPDVPLWLIAIDPHRSASAETILRFYREVWMLDKQEPLVEKAIEGCGP